MRRVHSGRWGSIVILHNFLFFITLSKSCLFTMLPNAWSAYHLHKLVVVYLLLSSVSIVYNVLCVLRSSSPLSLLFLEISTVFSNSKKCKLFQCSVHSILLLNHIFVVSNIFFVWGVVRHSLPYRRSELKSTKRNLFDVHTIISLLWTMFHT